MKIQPGACALSMTLCLALPAQSFGDWPQWRGPRRDNVSEETGWSSISRDEPLWSASIGTGYSSPVVADGRLFIVGYFDDAETPGEGVDRVLCLDAGTGAGVWSYSYPAKIYANEHAGGALSTPTVADGVLFVPTRSGEVRAFSAAAGELLWEVNLVERHGVEPGRYGFASSPYVLGPNIVLNAAHAVALNRANGETAWISDNYDANYSTVAELRLGERDCLAVFGGAGLAIVDSDSGENVHTWEFRKSPRNVEGSTPIVFGERVFVSTAYDQGAALVDFAGAEPELVWRTRRMRNKMAGCTFWDGHFYGFDESMLKCLDFEGNELWRKRGLGQGALMIADGRILLTSSEGELIVATATPDGYLEESRRTVIDGGVFWTAPLLANGRVYVRGSLGDLVCLDHRAGDVAGSSGAGGGETDARSLPSAEELVRNYVAVAGLAEREAVGLRMEGKLHVNALGLANVDAVWASAPTGKLHVRFGLPPGIGGSIDRVFNGELAWETNPYRGNSLIEGAQLAELQRTRGMRTVFDPLSGATESTGSTGPVAVTLADFRGATCYRVDFEIAPETRRQVFFDVKSGLLVGRTSAEEATVVFGDWREVDGVHLPFERTAFDPDTGQEERWRFEKASLEGPAEDVFAVPEGLLDRDDEPAEGEGEGDEGGDG